MGRRRGGGKDHGVTRRPSRPCDFQSPVFLFVFAQWDCWWWHEGGDPATPHASGPLSDDACAGGGAAAWTHAHRRGGGTRRERRRRLPRQGRQEGTARIRPMRTGSDGSGGPKIGPSLQSRVSYNFFRSAFKLSSTVGSGDRGPWAKRRGSWCTPRKLQILADTT